MSRYWCEEGEERLLEGQNYKFQVKGQSVTPHRDYVLRELEVTRLSGEGQVSAVQFLGYLLMILMNASGTFSDCNELVFISLFCMIWP